MEKDHNQPEDFVGRIIFMLVYDDIDWGQKSNEENCQQNSSSVAAYPERFLKRHWSFFGPGSEENPGVE